MEAVNILIAVRYQILRDGIQKILADESGLRIKGTAKDLKQLFRLPLDEGGILILDLGIANGDAPEIITEVNEQHQGIKILIISEKKDPEHIKRIMQAGAAGYIFKRQSSNDLLEAITEIKAGDKYLCDEIVRILLQEGNVADKVKNGKNSSTDLTDRELEVLALICQEMTNREISDKLHISVRTVDAHRRNILQKTGAKNTAGLVKYAIKHHIYNL